MCYPVNNNLSVIIIIFLIIVILSADAVLPDIAI